MIIRYIKNVDDDTIDRLSARMYLSDSMKSVIKSIITIKDLEITEEKFKDFLEEYQDKFIAFNMYRDKLSSTIIPKTLNVMNFKSFEYRYDFLFNSITLAIDIDSIDPTEIDSVLLNDGWIRKFDEVGNEEVNC